MFVRMANTENNIIKTTYVSREDERNSLTHTNMPRSRKRNARWAQSKKKYINNFHILKLHDFPNVRYNANADSEHNIIRIAVVWINEMHRSQLSRHTTTWMHIQRRDSNTNCFFIRSLNARIAYTFGWLFANSRMTCKIVGRASNAGSHWNAFQEPRRHEKKENRMHEG